MSSVGRSAGTGPSGKPVIPAFAANAFSAIKEKQERQKTPQPPNGIKFVERHEWDLWKAIVGIRSPSEWRDADLVLCAHVVRLELELRDLNEVIAKEGHIIQNLHGMSVAHPAVSIRRTVTVQLNALLDRLSYRSSVEADIRRTTATRAATRDLFESAECPDGLLAN